MRIYLIFAALIAGARSQFSIQIEFTRTSAQIGENVEVTCHVEDHRPDEEKDEFLVRWVKKIDGEEIGMGVNHFLEDDFTKTDRYKAKIMEDPNGKKVDFKISISDVKPEDSGEIGCLIDPQNVRAFKDFTVYGPVTSMAMTSSDVDETRMTSYTNGQNVTFNEDDKRRFYCHVNGSYPKPLVKMMIGDTDITHLFQQESKLLKTNGATRLKKLSYDVTLKNESFAMQYKYSSKHLKCFAVVPKSGLPEKSIEIFVKLNEYKPKFDCPREMTVALNKKNFEIRCPVRADPKINGFNIFWESGSDNKTLESGQSDGHLRAEVDEVDEYEVVMILKIDRVYDQHFRSYYFEAENTLGKVIHEVKLRNDPNAYDSTGEAHHPVGSLMTFIASLLLAALL